MKKMNLREVDFNFVLDRGYDIGDISIPVEGVTFAVRNPQLLKLAHKDCPDSLLETFEGLVEHDIINVGSCILYLRAKHPHASLILQLDSIRVSNLTMEEKIDCLSQSALKFSFRVLDIDGSEVKVYEFR